jgi:hypothetical protein
MHIPLQPRAKDSRRAYAIFDKACAHKLFGYRVKFDAAEMSFKSPAYDASQKHKPLALFVADVVSDLSQGYASVKFTTK